MNQLHSCIIRCCIGFPVSSLFAHNASLVDRWEKYKGINSFNCLWCVVMNYLRIKTFRLKLSLVPDKDRVRLDAWTCKSMLSFIKMKTHKRLGSQATWSKTGGRVYVAKLCSSKALHARKRCNFAVYTTWYVWTWKSLERYCTLMISPSWVPGRLDAVSTHHHP